MKPLSPAVLASLLCSAAAPAQTQPADYLPELITLIAELANPDALAKRCEEDMMNSGKDALGKAMCANFTGHYAELWPSHDALSNQIVEFARRVEHGEIACDDNCRSMLRRYEELRISIRYVFDYRFRQIAVTAVPASNSADRIQGGLKGGPARRLCGHGTRHQHDFLMIPACNQDAGHRLTRGRRE
jgi:hypothetical protein